MSSFLDLSKAFDCVDYATLLRKLYCYNIHPSSCKPILSYLTHRYQRVITNDKISGELPLRIGVPQGSVLGPLLSIIFINDLPSYLTGSVTTLFADDTIVSSVGANMDDTTVLNKAQQEMAFGWFNGNGLSVNRDKCVEIMLDRKSVV